MNATRQNTFGIAWLALTVLTCCWFVPSPVISQQPLALHPDNPHYFLWGGQPTLLITSGEHYGALMNLDFDYAAYFDALAADKLNLTRTFSGVYRETADSFNITDNTLAPKPLRFVCPWARSDRPGYFDAGNKFDLSNWDEAYFQRLHDFMRHAQSRGVVVEFNLFCPMYDDAMWAASPMNPANNVNDVPACDREEVYTLKHPKLLEVQLAVTRKIVQELNGFDNLYFEICNEPYFGGVTMPWQHRIIEEIVRAEDRLPQRHLISLNIANGRQKVDAPHPHVSIYNFHYCVPPDTVAMNYGLNKVIGENETGFRGQEDLLYRTEGWNFIIAGGALYNNLDYSFTPQHPGGTFLDYKSPGGGSPALRKQLSILRDFIQSFDFIRMKPDDTVVANVPDGMAARAMAEQGRAYAVYLHVSLPKELDLAKLERPRQTSLNLNLPAGRYQADWINTKNGTIEKTETFQHDGGAKSLASPEFVVDVALSVKHS